ncbi:DNA glycosylase [Clostridium sp. BJN0001]|uniref:DNA-3-methyladenine glycosylase family protein n=1 Tax=Clostridium sp. BJN0001 TaxID=2930219 RepID=UPI001FD28A6A|nr:DNA glycosylase [Clostridium sp. BJN0001]
MDYETVFERGDHAVISGVKNFSIKQTFESGQSFRFYKKSDTHYILVAHSKVIELVQENDEIHIFNTNKKEVEDVWIDYFDLERDYSCIKEKLSDDSLLKKSIEFGEGIRILNQDPFEILISFIISARNNIPSIMKTINKISEKWGNKIEYKGETYYTFPTIMQIKDASLDEIKETGASFRSKYILDTIGKIYSSYVNENDLSDEEEIQKYDLNYIKNLNDDECHKALQEFKGVGSKVADCVMLFSMQKHSAFPVDVWVKRAMIHFYGASDVSLNKIRIFGRDKFKTLSGFAQQYLFYYARENKIKL